MELSVFIARILSLIYLCAGISAILNDEYYRRLVADLFNNAALTYVTGFMTVVIGCFMVNYHNFWVADWTVLITIIGWLALIKGAAILSVPKYVQGYSKAILEGRGFHLFPYIAFGFGLLFGYLGFIA